MPAVLVVVLLTQSSHFVVGYRDILRSDYIDFFPDYLSPALNQTTMVASSEAGRLPYWSNGKHFDLVGLNTPQFARNGVTAGDIRSMNPDLLLIHTAELWSVPCPDKLRFCEVHWDQQEVRLSQDARARNTNVHIASVAVFDFLRVSFPEYKVFSVKYGDGFNHVWAINSTSTELVTSFELALSRSFEELDSGGRGYLQLEGESDNGGLAN